MKKWIVLISSIALIACKTQQSGVNTLEDLSAEVQIQEEMDNEPWLGTYKGVISCKNCEGNQIELSLNPNRRYLLKEFNSKTNKINEEDGVILWIEKGKEFELSKSNRFFSIENGYIAQLDDEKKPIFNSVADNGFIYKDIFQLYSTLWQWESIDNNTIDNSKVNTYLIVRTDGSYKLSFSCNKCQGKYKSVIEGEIIFYPAVCTKIGCKSPLSNYENTFHQLVDKISYYKIESGILTLFNKQGLPLAKLRDPLF